jgi:hypothetical protein
MKHSQLHNGIADENAIHPADLIEPDADQDEGRDADILRHYIEATDAYLCRGKSDGFKARWYVLTHLIGIHDYSFTEIAKRAGVTRQAVSAIAQDAEKAFGIRSPHSRSKEALRR